MAECTSKQVDLGECVGSAELRYVDGVLEGLYYEHACVNDACSPGWIPFTGHGAWKVLCEEPLTVMPSLLCRHCGHHGFIRDGVFISC